MADEFKKDATVCATGSSCKQAESPPNRHTRPADNDALNRYDIWQDFCEVKEARIELSDSRKRRTGPLSETCSENAPVDYQSLLAIEVEVKRRKLSERDEAAALSYLLAPGANFPIKRQGSPDHTGGVGARENALDMLAAMNLITVDSNGDITSISDSARVFAEQLGCARSTVVKATELSAYPGAEELANFPSVMEMEKKKVRIWNGKCKIHKN